MGIGRTMGYDRTKNGTKVVEISNKIKNIIRGKRERKLTMQHY